MSETQPMPKTRLSIPEYAMALAHVASLRSEDPYRKVGAVAFDFDNRVIGTAYNGLAPGFNADHEFWIDRDARRKFMLHAEVNLCSLFTRGNVKLIACTTEPCTSCTQMLCAYGVKEIYYRDGYADSEARAICALYGITLTQLTDYPLIVSSIDTPPAS
jgi:dCMP deaminase